MQYVAFCVRLRFLRLSKAAFLSSHVSARGGSPEHRRRKNWGVGVGIRNKGPPAPGGRQGSAGERQQEGAWSALFQSPAGSGLSLFLREILRPSVKSVIARHAGVRALQGIKCPGLLCVLKLDRGEEDWSPLSGGST